MDKILPYLTHPLALVGYVMMLFFSILHALIHKGIITPISGRSSSKVVQLILKYGVWLAGMTIILGFGLQALGFATKALRINKLGANTVKAYQSSFELYGQPGARGSNVFAAADTTFAPYVPINEAFSAPTRSNESHTGRYSLDFTPEGNPVVRPTKVAYAIGATVAVSAGVLDVTFDVSEAKALNVAFFARSSSNPRPSSVHNCDSALAIYVRRDDGPWEHFTSQCGSHKSESRDWGEHRYIIPANGAATMQLAFVYQLQNSEIADPDARFLVDDLDVRVWPIDGAS